MKKYYTILDIDANLVNVEFGTSSDVEFFKDTTRYCNVLYMNNYTLNYFLKNNLIHHINQNFRSDGTSEFKLNGNQISIDEELPDKWVIFKNQLEYAHGFVAAINDCRKEKTMTKVNVIDHKNDQYTCPEDFKEKDWFYNTLDQHHYYLMPLVDFLEDRVALINIEYNQCIAIGKSAEGAINGSFSEDGANYLIKIPADQVEVTYKFYPDQD